MNYMVYRIREFFQEINYFIQRGKRGYSDRDLWDVNYYIAETLSPMMRHLANVSSGCPTSLFDESNKDNECHKWTKILNQIADGFDKYIEQKDDVNTYYKDTPKETKEALRLFAEYFGCFWD